MAEDWLADVRKFDADADENVVGAIIKYCGIALRTPNAATVTFSDPTETGRVRDNFLKKKLALTDDDATLDAAIVTVGEAMGGGDQNRVSVYYLLTKHFNMFETFGGTAGGGGGATPAAAAAATGAAAAAASPAPAAPAPVSSAHSPTRPTGSSGSGSTGGSDDADDMFGLGCVAGLVALGAIILAAIISVWASNTILTSDDAPETEAAAPAPAPEPEPEPSAAPEPEVPEGAGVTAGERDGKPLLTVYFDSGSSAVAPDFEQVSAEIRGYLEENPDAKVEISGFNDPTGNAEINARLSRERAENVQAQMVALGIAEDRTDLVKPDDTTTSDMSPEEARRVEITIVE